MPHSNGPGVGPGKPAPSSALGRSAFQRLLVVAGPILLLWGVVSLALDVFA